MILKEKTFDTYGYKTDELPETSVLPVWWKCDECGFERQYPNAYCKRKELKAAETDNKELCQKCGHAHRKGKATVPVQKLSHLPLPPETDVQATIERFGYHPDTIAPWSRERIMVRCKETGKLCSPRRCSLNRYKSMIETGHFYSTGAWTSKRRKGNKASDETKKAMKSSQNARRKREKELTSSGKESVNSAYNPYYMPYKN